MTRSTVTLVLLAAAGCYTGSGGGGADDDADGSSASASEDAGEADDDAGDDADDGDPPGVECDSDAPKASLLRISRINYVNALEDVFGVAVVDAVRNTVDALPAAQSGLFAPEVPPPTFSEVSSYVEIASALSYELTKDAASLAALSPCLADVAPGADAASDPCLSALLDDFGRRLFRRPLTDADRVRLADDYAVGGDTNVNEGVATLLTAMLVDPAFLYFVEVEGEEIAEGIVELTSHELAARLARVLWDSVPDAELMEAADDGLDDDALVAQIERMLADDRARSAVSRFYRDWLSLDTLPIPPEALFPDAAVREALRADMEAELLGFAELVTLDADGTYPDLLLDRTAIVATGELADIYGVGTGEVTLPEDERAGLLTRAGWLATTEIRASDAGHLIKRGAKLGRLMCRELPPPDPGNFPQEDPADPASNPNAGIRERFQAATTDPMCSGCHTQLDAFGAPFGHYGAAGQWIAQETITLEDGSSVQLDIDTASQISFTTEETLDIADALVLSQELANSGIGAQCFAQQVARNIVARPLEDADQCLSNVGSNLLAPAQGEPASLRDAIVAMLTSDQFRRVAIP
jgi:hypothetical protein